MALLGQNVLNKIPKGSRVEVHYDDVKMSLMASHITSLTIVYSTVYSGVDQRKHQSSASLAICAGIHRGPVNSPHKWPVMWKMFPFDDVIMEVVLVYSVESDATYNDYGKIPLKHGQSSLKYT